MRTKRYIVSSHCLVRCIGVLIELFRSVQCTDSNIAFYVEQLMFYWEKWLGNIKSFHQTIIMLRPYYLFGVKI